MSGVVQIANGKYVCLGFNTFLARFIVIGGLSYFLLDHMIDIGTHVKPDKFLSHAKVGLIGSLGSMASEKWIEPYTGSSCDRLM